jgi:hypothetical protein
MVGAFDFRIDDSGVTVVIAQLPVAPTCRDEDSIDASIRALKKDLDMVAATMKEALRRREHEEVTIIPFPPNPAQL